MKNQQQQKKVIEQGRFRKTSCSAYLATIALLCLLLSACEKEECDCYPEMPTRTILFYMGGDNNLSDEVAAKVERLLSAPIAPDCRLLVYTDNRGEMPRLSEIASGKNEVNTLAVIKTYEESSSASAEVFSAVLQEVTQLYPSHSYGLVVFSHASGWLPEGTYLRPALRSAALMPSSVIIDHKAEMELPAFAAAIPNGMFDFIIFEMCFMAGIEVVWELKDKTDYVVASSAELVSPGFTTVWLQALPLLFKPVPDLAGFVDAVEADFRGREGDYASLTLSLIKTEKLDALAAVIQNSMLRDGGEQKGSSSAPKQTFDRGSDSLFFDFGEYYRMMASDNAPLQAALDDCVIRKTATAAFMPNYGGFDIVLHSGLTTYVPQNRYPALNEAYKQLKWYKTVNNHK